MNIEQFGNDANRIKRLLRFSVSILFLLYEKLTRSFDLVQLV